MGLKIIFLTLWAKKISLHQGIWMVLPPIARGPTEKGGFSGFIDGGPFLYILPNPGIRSLPREIYITDHQYIMLWHMDWLS
jgi:hypothetical protein